MTIYCTIWVPNYTPKITSSHSEYTSIFVYSQPERKKTVVAESERFVAIQSHGFPKSPSPIVSGLVIGYCTAESVIIVLTSKFYPSHVHFSCIMDLFDFLVVIFMDETEPMTAEDSINFYGKDMGKSVGG